MWNMRCVLYALQYINPKLEYRNAEKKYKIQMFEIPKECFGHLHFCYLALFRSSCLGFRVFCSLSDNCLTDAFFIPNPRSHISYQDMLL
jgi:hypothetical protein